MDIVNNPGQYHIYSFDDIFKPFVNRRGDEVIDFRSPRARLSVDPHRLGGWPTITGTRVPYDTVASALRGGDLRPEDIRHYYPGVSKAAAKDALSFADEVERRRKKPGGVKFFVDENVNRGCLEPLRTVYRDHKFDYAFDERLSSTNDIPLFETLAKRRYDAIIHEGPRAATRR